MLTGTVIFPAQEIVRFCKRRAHSWNLYSTS